MLKPHALIIDDSKTSQIITEHLLFSLDVAFISVKDEQSAWKQIHNSSTPFSLILVSQHTLPKALAEWISKLRSTKSYHSTPVILLVDGKSHASHITAHYDAGFTQVFCRQDVDLLSAYIKQTQQRNTFSVNRENKVIIIEDDLVQQMVVRAILEEHQCECFCFSSAEAALAQADEIKPHVILCDFFLEGAMTALDFILLCKESKHTWVQVPILVMTAMDDSARKVELVRSGANDYLLKPLDPVDVSLRVENLIRYKHLLDKVESQHQEMQYLAMHDQLTGLYNRHFVAEQVELIFNETRRYGNTCALIMLDIDHFKRINDQYGHDVGDDVLVGIGELLKKQSRNSDIAARLGGEEFIIILRNCNEEDALIKANALREDIELTKPGDTFVTASFGVAVFNEQYNNYEKLFKAADQAVYEAKKSGRNQVRSAA